MDRDELRDKPYQSTHPQDFEDKIMNPNIPKSEAEWWARNRIQELQWTIKRYINGGERCKEEK